MDIFDFDIYPGAPIKKLDMGKCAFASDGQPAMSARTVPLKKY